MGMVRQFVSGTRSSWSERGASAVEFAIIFPLLLLMIGGVVDLGRYMFTKSMLTNVAREGARSIAVGYSEAESTTRMNVATAGAFGTTTPIPTRLVVTYAYKDGANTVSACPASPGPQANVTVTVKTPASGPYQFKYIILGPASSLIPGATALSAPVLVGTANMRCGG